MLSLGWVLLALSMIAIWFTISCASLSTRAARAVFIWSRVVSCTTTRDGDHGLVHAHGLARAQSTVYNPWPAYIDSLSSILSLTLKSGRSRSCEDTSVGGVPGV